jgi:hypothetical protein
LLPEEFTQPVLKRLRSDILVVIDKNELDPSSVIAVLSDVMGHALGSAPNEDVLEQAIITTNAMISRNAREIFAEKSSAFFIDED